MLAEASSEIGQTGWSTTSSIQLPSNTPRRISQTLWRSVVIFSTCCDPFPFPSRGVSFSPDGAPPTKEGSLVVPEPFHRASPSRRRPTLTRAPVNLVTPRPCRSYPKTFPPGLRCDSFMYFIPTTLKRNNKESVLMSDSLFASFGTLGKRS